jgi:hydrogenase maturation protease
MANTRIVGCGNLNRGDDAAGLLVAHRLRDLGIPATDAGTELLGMITEFQREETLILVDAALAPDLPPGEIIRLRANDLPRHAQEFHFSTHGIGLAEAVGMASALGRLPENTLIIGINGKCFDAGASVSKSVHAAIDAVVAEISSAYRSSDPTAWDRLCPVDPAAGHHDVPAG